MQRIISILIAIKLTFLLAGCILPPTPEFEDLIYKPDDKEGLIALTFDFEPKADYLLSGTVYFQKFDPDQFKFSEKVIKKDFCEGCSFHGSLKTYMSTKGRPFQVGKLKPGYYGIRKIIYREIVYSKGWWDRYSYLNSHFCINENVEIFRVLPGVVNAIDLFKIGAQDKSTTQEVHNLFKLVTIETETKAVRPLVRVSFLNQRCNAGNNIFSNTGFDVVEIYD